MAITINQKKEEAKKRMEMLGMNPKFIREFMANGLVGIANVPDEFHVPVEADLDRIREFENDHNALVYAVIRGCGGSDVDVDSYLFVSKYDEEWEAEAEDLQNNECCAYVYNRTIPEFSEIGYIGIEKMPNGGLARAW